MNVTVPLTSDKGDEYVVRLSSFNKSLFPDEVSTIIKDLDIADIVLEKISGEHKIDINTLFQISHIVWNFINDNENMVLYFYCDDMKDLPRSKKNSILSPQHYRSTLFSRMFDRFMASNYIKDFINLPIIIKVKDRDIYIHLISRKGNIEAVDNIKEMIHSQSK